MVGGLLQRHPEVRADFGAPRRMMFSSVLAAILRGAQERAPQDDVEMASSALRMTQRRNLI
jgi:hypothetical protein